MTLKNSTMGNERVSENKFENRWDKSPDQLQMKDQLKFEEMFKAPGILPDTI